MQVGDQRHLLAVGHRHPDRRRWWPPAGSRRRPRRSRSGRRRAPAPCRAASRSSRRRLDQPPAAGCAPRGRWPPPARRWRGRWQRPGRPRASPPPSAAPAACRRGRSRRPPPSPRPAGRRPRPARPGRRRPARRLAPARPTAPCAGCRPRTDLPCATESGACWPISAATRLWISASRSDGCARAGVGSRRARPPAASSPHARSRRSRSRPCRVDAEHAHLAAVYRRGRTRPNSVFPPQRGLRIMPPVQCRAWSSRRGRALVGAARAAAGGAFSAAGRGRLVIWLVLRRRGSPSADSLLHDYGYLGVAIGAFGDSFGLPSSGEIVLLLARRRGRGQLQHFSLPLVIAVAWAFARARRRLRLRDRPRRRPAACCTASACTRTASVHGFMARYGARAVAAGAADRGHPHQAGDRLRQHPHAVAPLPASRTPSAPPCGRSWSALLGYLFSSSVSTLIDRFGSASHAAGRDRDRRGRGAWWST